MRSVRRKRDPDGAGTDGGTSEGHSWDDALLSTPDHGLAEITFRQTVRGYT